MLTQPETHSEVKPVLKTTQLPLFVLAFILVVASGVRLWYGSFVIDDAYITFRYSRNLAQGLGLVYNPDGRHILGTTTPLFALLLSVPGWLGLSLEGASLWISLLSDCATISLLYLFGRKLSMPYVGLAAGMLVALWPDYVNYATSGMETSLYTALLVGSIYFYMQRNFGVVGLLLALLVLTRPDGLILVGLLFCHYLWRERRLPWRMGLIFVPLPLGWVIFAMLYFGSPVSQSLISKAAQVDTTPAQSFIQLLIFLNQSIKPLFTVLAALGIFAIIRGRNFQLLRLPLGWWLLYCAIFVAQGAFHLFPWYYIPLLPFYFLFAVVGVAGIGEPLREKLSQAQGRKLVQGGLLTLSLFGTGILLWLAVANRQTLSDSQVGREVLYREIASNQLAKSGLIAAKEIGTLGYFCNCEIYDLAGLVTPEALKRPELELLQEVRPEYIVVYNNLLRPETLNSEWLKQNYETLEVRPVEVFGQSELYIFRRRN